jgi:hypothetical protein
VFLGKIAAKKNLSGILVKLARETGAKAKEERTRVTGVVTRGGKPVTGGGRVGGWKKSPKEMDRVNVTIERGRTVPTKGFEFAWSRVGPDGTYTLEHLKPGPGFGPWYFVYEEPGRAPAVAGPVTITNKHRSLTADIPVADGGAIEGRVANVPAAMAGQVWVIAFDSGVIRREVLAAAAGTFRLQDLPPGRYGLKAGHDAYVDPHVPRWKVGEQRDPAMWQKSAEPWQGAVTVTVEPGRTSRGVVIDLRPPGPIVEKEPAPRKQPAR